MTPRTEVALAGLRVAVIHDWLTGMRGGEKVLEAILELLPQAEIFTLFHHEGSVSEAIGAHPIHTAWTDRLSSLASDYRRLLPLMPAAIRSFDLSAFDLIVSSSHCVAKGVRVPPDTPHVSYCHTPMRYVWDRFDDYFPHSRPLLRAAASVMAPPLRRWDVKTARGVSAFVANSRFVAGRIEQYYGRASEVVYPFVDGALLDRPLSRNRGDYHLVVSALVPYKRIDVAMRAAALAGRRLVVAGGGPLLDRYRAEAPSGIELRGRVSDSELAELLAGAQSLILPGVEDFGITPLEAMACGTPVIALGDGGALESVSDGTTGILVGRPHPEAFAAAMLEVERIGWDRAVLRERAGEFRREHFLEQFASILRRETGT